MLRCLFCDAELSDSLLRSGCCPNCGGRLMWPEDESQPPLPRSAAPPSPEAPALAPDEPPPTSTPAVPVLPAPMPHSPVIASRNVKNEVRPLQPPPPMDPPDDPPASSEPDRSRADELPPEVLARVTAAWSRAFDSQTAPRHTIKISSLDTADAPPLVIRERQLGGRGRPPAVEQPDYELLDVIGEGGVGVVYAARQNSIDRMVAVKMLKPGHDESDAPQEKFLSEAVVTGELEHPNIVPIYDLGSTHDGTLFYSMKRVQGTPWDRAMADKSLPENLEILMKVCDAIAFAHSRGVIHRDLKPENVMLGGFGEVLVMDWGIALSWSTDGKGRNIRQSATMGGTPAYMSPEMATGPLEKIAIPSDIYLLGGILYEIVTGLAPHTGRTVMDCLYAAAANEIQETAERGELIEIALRAMATDPQDRHQSVKEFQDSIRDYQSHAESIVLSQRAQEDLEEAIKDRTYERFARALFAFEEAAALWPGNGVAERGGVEARRAYAQAALDKQDYELGLSLVDPKNVRHRAVAELLERGQREQAMRTLRIRMLRRVAAGLIVALLTGGTLAFVEINEKRATAESEQKKAEVARSRLQESVVRNSDLLRDKVGLLSDVSKERDRAKSALKEEAAARAAAQLARKREQRETYLAQIGLAAERIKANAFDQAAELLENYRHSPLANWEWGRLSYMCSPHQSMHDAGRTLALVRFLADGQRFVTITESGAVSVWSPGETISAAPQQLAAFSLPISAPVCALSHDGRMLAVAAAGSPEIRLFELDRSEDGAPIGLLQPEPRATLAGHSGDVTSLEFSADDTQLLSASLDHSARLWDVASGRQLLEFLGHNWSVWQATFSPGADDRMMVTAGQDGRVIVWSTADGTQITDFNEHRGPVYAVAVSADGRRVASAGEDRRILVWDWRQVPPLDLQQLISSGARPKVPYATLQGHRAEIRVLQFSPVNPGRLVSGSGDNSLLVWEIAGEPTEGQVLVPLRGHSRRVTTCAIAPDGRHVLSGGEDRKWGLWDIAGFQEVNQLRSTSLRGHENGILAARFGNDSRHIVTASLDRTARTWDSAAGTALQTFQQGHEFLATTAVALPDGHQLLTSAGDNTARLWDLTVGGQTAVLQGTGRHAALAVSQDGRFALTGAIPGETPQPETSQTVRSYARLWDLQSRSQVRTLTETVATELIAATPLSAVTAVAIHPDGTTFYTGHADGQGRLWRGANEPPVLLIGHTRGVSCAVFTPDGSRLLTGSGDQSVAQWDAASGRELIDRVLRHDGWVTSLSLVDDGRTAVTAADDGLVRFWDVESAHELARVDGSGRVQQGLLFSGDGRALIWQGDDGAVRITDPAGEVEERTLDAVTGAWISSLARSPAGDSLAIVTGHGEIVIVALDTGLVLHRIASTGIVDAAFTPDGAALVCAGRDGDVRIIDVAGRNPLRQWHAHDGGVQRVIVSANGSRIATAGADGNVRLWDAASAQAVQTLTVGNSPVAAAALARDASTVVAGDDAGTVRWWSTDGNLLGDWSAHPGGIRAVALSPDGRWLASGGADRLIRIWERGSTSPVAVLEAHQGAIRSLDFNSAGTLLASLAGDRAVRLWQVNGWKWQADIPRARGMSTHPIVASSADGRTAVIGNSAERRFTVHSVDRSRSPMLATGREFRIETGAVWSALLTRDGGSLVTIGGDSARAWDLQSGRELLTMRPNRVVSAVAYAPDGTRIVTGGWEPAARIWDAATGRVVRQLTGGHVGNVTQTAWLANGRQIITTGDDGAIRVWDADSGALDGAPLSESGAAVIGLAVTRDGRRALTVSSDDVLRLWDIEPRTLLQQWTSDEIGAGGASLVACALDPAGRRIAVGTAQNVVVFDTGLQQPPLVLSGHTAAILAVGFSPDGKRLATGSEDFTAKVWDVVAGKEMLSLARHTGAVTAVEFSRDGRSVLTAGRDGLAIVWRADAIAPAVQVGRDRFDYRTTDQIVVLDPTMELNAPTTESLAGLTIRVQLATATEATEGTGNLCFATEENSTVTIAGSEVSVTADDGTTTPAARAEWSTDARQVELTFTPESDLAAVNAVLRQIAYQLPPQSAAAASADESRVETVTIEVFSQMDSATIAERTSIDIQVLPGADTNVGSVLEDVESVLESLDTREGSP